MGSKLFKRDVLPVVAALFLGLILIGLEIKWRPDNAETELTFRMIPPPPHVERFVFGYRETLADLFWVRVIQDFDICENAKNGRAGGTEERGPTSTCKLGWVYRMLDAVTTLAPKWKLPYSTGGTLLSIMVDDREGAALILEKGMKEFPKDYNLHYTAAYHYIYELKNPKRAAETLLVAAENGGPSWFYSLAGKLYTEAGQAFLAKQVLEDALKVERNQIAGDRIRKRIQEAEAVLRKNGISVE